MARETPHLLRIVVILLGGILLMGQDCPAQTGLCDPDPCASIQDAVPDTCVPVAGSCTPASDFACSCDTGYAWQDATNTCEGVPTLGMAQIPGGCFDMGDHFGDGDDRELPVHNVCISAFEMDVHEVTNGEYAECVDDGVCTAPYRTDSNTRTTYYGNPAYGEHPVIWTSWYQAEEYCTWAGKRLPTEAEWEYAARGGLAGKRYPWGDTINGSDANYWDSGDPWDNDTSEVEYFPPNGYGLYDMAGNLWELVNDWYQYDYYAVSPSNDPPGPVDGTVRVLRGGSWDNQVFALRVSYRNSSGPVGGNNDVGFRCARGGAYGP
jgi:formylglycine-generating enzyme required for sulfatase activity